LMIFLRFLLFSFIVLSFVLPVFLKCNILKSIYNIIKQKCKQLLEPADRKGPPLSYDDIYFSPPENMSQVQSNYAVSLSCFMKPETLKKLGGIDHEARYFILGLRYVSLAFISEAKELNITQKINIDHEIKNDDPLAVIIKSIFKFVDLINNITKEIEEEKSINTMKLSRRSWRLIVSFYSLFLQMEPEFILDNLEKYLTDFKDQLSIAQGKSKDISSLISINDFAKYACLFHKISHTGNPQTITIVEPNFEYFKTKLTQFPILHDFLTSLIKSGLQVDNVKTYINLQTARFGYGVSDNTIIRHTTSKWLKVFKDFGNFFPLPFCEEENAFSLPDLHLYLSYFTQNNMDKSIYSIIFGQIQFNGPRYLNTPWIENLKEELSPNFWQMCDLYKTYYVKNKKIKEIRTSILSVLEDIKIAFNIYTDIAVKKFDKAMEASFKEFIERLIYYTIRNASADWPTIFK